MTEYYNSVDRLLT